MGDDAERNEPAPQRALARSLARTGPSSQTALAEYDGFDLARHNELLEAAREVGLDVRDTALERLAQVVLAQATRHGGRQALRVRTTLGAQELGARLDPLLPERLRGAVQVEVDDGVALVRVPVPAVVARDDRAAGAVWRAQARAIGLAVAVAFAFTRGVVAALVVGAAALLLARVGRRRAVQELGAARDDAHAAVALGLARLSHDHQLVLPLREPSTRG